MRCLEKISLFGVRMSSCIAILSLLLVSALIEATEVKGLETTPFKCVQCTDCTSPESVTRLIVCNDLLSTIHKPHCTTTYTNDGRVHRGCGGADTARQDGCRQLVDEKTLEPELVCSCGWSECNAPEVAIQSKLERDYYDDGNVDDEELWVPATRHSDTTKIIGIVFGAIFLIALLGGLIFSASMCMKCCPARRRRPVTYFEETYQY